MITVKDSQPWHWYLLQEGESLFLDANCNHSFIGYNFTIELNEAERERFAVVGRNYLTDLANQIQNEVPILKESRSNFKGRNVSDELSERITEAILLWNNRVAPEGP
jgi:hypothetical protein